MSVFSWIPDKGVKGKRKPRNLSVSYGDGYEQTVGDGINNDPKTYSLQFTLINEATFDSIMSFLETHAGRTAFDWTPPGGTAGRYLCQEWDDDTDGITYSITMSFREVFGV